MIQCNTSVFFIAALMLLLLPFDWIAAVIAASVFHELCHIFILYVLKGNVLKIHVQVSGCIIETGTLAEWKKFLSILAGPLGSFSLLFLSRTAPKLAICGLAQGLYNLLPVLPLDGGRLLQIMLYRFCPRQAENVMDVIAIGNCFAFDLLAIWFSTVESAGIWPLIMALIWNIKMMPRKIPCKPP